MYNILVIDDEQSMLDVITEVLNKKDYNVLQADDGEKGLAILENHRIDVVICDIRMSPINGMDVLKKVKQIDPDIIFIIITAYGSIENAVECMRQGAYEYILKPFKIDELRILVQRALEHKGLTKENILLKRQLQEKYHFKNIIGKSVPMQKVYDLMHRIIQTDSTVLICGESGTGKELVAKAIHYHSHRKNKLFVAINCGGLPESLLESELFGHVKGAFTGAVGDKAGLFQIADKGTIFLDEISATSPVIQVKLLRVLQEKEIKKVGDTKDINVDVRVITATNTQLEEQVKLGNFREDLFYRLNVIPIQLPPLRERREDIPLLVQHFLQKHCKLESNNRKTVSPDTLKILINYGWPGNVRELENVVERAVALCEGSEIMIHDLPERLIECVKSQGIISMKIKDVMRQKEKEYILQIIAQNNGNKKETAKILGVDLATLYRKLQ